MSGTTDQIGVRPQVFAHRGFHGVNGISENSLGAFQAAVDAGVDAIELDVHRTRDGVMITFHDPALPDGRMLRDLDYAALPVLPDGQQIPTLEQVADLARRTGVHMSVELKEAGYERAAAFLLASRVPMSQVDIISFNRKSIAELEAFDPSIRTGLLEPRLPAFLRNSALYPAALWVMDKLDWHPSLRAAARVGADFVSVEHRMATPKFLAQANDRGMPVLAWTVDDTARMAQLVQDGATGIVTDRPDLAVALRDAAAAAARPAA
jgi:glycerophosphoryl diester phosphodiesterase